MMEELKITKWGNSNGLRLPKNIMDYLKVRTNDTLRLEKEEIGGTRRIILNALPRVTQEMTIQELFADYDIKGAKIDFQDIEISVGEEQW